MLVALQLVTVAAVPLNLTVLLPCVVPKLDPAIVTEAPTAPVLGVRLEIVGAAAACVAPKTNTNRHTNSVVARMSSFGWDMAETRALAVPWVGRGGAGDRRSVL